MTPRERVLAVFHHKMPDRIPKFEIWIDGLYDALGCLDPAGIYAHLGQDCVMMPSQQPAESPAWRTGIDEFGRVWRDGLYVDGVVDSPDSLLNYSPPLTAVDTYFDPIQIDKVRYQYADYCLIWGTHIGPMTAAYMAMGFSRFFLNLYDNPGFLHLVLEKRTEWCITMYKTAQNLGAEILILGDDAGTVDGPMISPQMWREFILPYHRYIVDSLDVPVIWHSDGNIVPLLQSAIEAGFSGYHGVDPIAGVDLAEVKSQYGKELVLIGNLDVRLLYSSNLEAIHHEVDRCISQGAKCGGYMFASCNSICDGMNPAAVIEMYKHVGAAEV